MSIFHRPDEASFMQNLHNCGYDGAFKASTSMGTASVQADKVVNVRMSESEHTLLKTYCASLNRSMQDVLRDFALMEEHGVDQDPRAKKPCAGYSCYYCRHAEACKDGETDLLFIPRQELREMVTEECSYILNFDGSSIEAPHKAG